MWHSLPSCDRGSAGKVVRSAELSCDSLSFLLHLMGLLVPGNTLERQEFSLKKPNGQIIAEQMWPVFHLCLISVASL